jgi:prefoldin subunit 5
MSQTTLERLEEENRTLMAEHSALRSVTDQYRRMYDELQRREVEHEELIRVLRAEITRVTEVSRGKDAQIEALRQRFTVIDEATRRLVETLDT